MTGTRAHADALRVGYACVNTQLPSASRTLRMANVTAERLRDLIGADLDALEAIVHWNQAHGIEVFRLTSNLIPFGSPRERARVVSGPEARQLLLIAQQLRDSRLLRTAVPARC